jgi:hypothetical protein
MITNSAQFTLDAIEHMRTLTKSDRDDHFNDLIPVICELDNETSSRIMYTVMKTFDDMSPNNVPNFKLFHKKHGTYIFDSVKLELQTKINPEWHKLYTSEDAAK